MLLLLLAQLQALPPQLVALDSDEGRKLLTESTASRDFFALVGTFQQQKSGSLCGVASSAMVLNAMPLRAPEVPEMAGFRAFTQENVFDKAALESVARGGATMEQLAAYLRSAGADARIVHASESTLEAFRAEAARNLANPDDFLLVDFLRSELGQDFGAHWSPLAAYHAASDRFLVLDVNRVRYPPYWARAADLFKAMNTRDPDAGASRGWLVVSPHPGAPGRVEVPPIGHKLFRILALAALGLFALGAVAGGLFARWRLLRKGGQGAGQAG
ncbi:MAG: phytochelatin synthase family protein [Myxococcales bacterium]